MQKLVEYFLKDTNSETLKSIGMEVETQFVDFEGRPITTKTSQGVLNYLTGKGWRTEIRKNGLITSLVDKKGNRISYELGRQNLEISAVAMRPAMVLSNMGECLDQLYDAACLFDSQPFFQPVLEGAEDLLVIPDERDAIWLKIDGRSNLAPLARTSSVQFTVSVSCCDAVKVLNNLGSKIDLFLQDYPQEVIWKKYIEDSWADYRPDRYGGPLLFESVEDYCFNLAKNDVIVGTELVPFGEVNTLDIPLFLRSIWWYFRLKKYGSALCVEVRPMARRTDDYFKTYLDRVLEIVEG